MQVERRVHVAMIHARNTKVEPSIMPMLKDTVNIIMEEVATHYKAREAEPTVVSCMGDVECPKCANRFTVNRKHIFPQDIQTTSSKESSS